MILSSIKSNTLKDLICTVPHIFDAAFNKYSIIKAFIDSGIPDHRTHICPDIIRIVNSFKTNYDKAPGDKAWIEKMVPLYT